VRKPAIQAPPLSGVKTGSDASPTIVLSQVSKDYRLARGRALQALADIDLRVAPGEFVALIGQSGCGKSTVVRLIAGLEEPTSGSVLVGGAPPASFLAERRLGVAFQEHALLPWSSVRDNVALPFRVAGLPVDRERIGHMLDLVGLGDFADARPSQLSGGMKQRAAIARALVMDPDVLLLDEPFGALDAVTRRHMNLELARIWAERRISALLVTHDVNEAVLLADRVVVLSARPGRVRHVETIDVPREKRAEAGHASEVQDVSLRLLQLLDQDATA